jgi:periplasmic iron binding protein
MSAPGRPSGGRPRARRALVAGLGLALLALVATGARAQGSLRIPIGAPELREDLRISAGFLLRAPVLEPPGPAVDAAAVIHLQLEVDALRGNSYGFEPEDSVPYLRLPFALVHDRSGRRHEGVLTPMVSRDGFHYGATVPLPGPGVYTLTVEIRPPEGLVRHVDPRTGVSGWWSAFPVSWSFRYPPD